MVRVRVVVPRRYEVQNNKYAIGGPDFFGWLKNLGRKVVDSEARNAPEYETGTFGEAYSDAKKKGNNTFWYNGNYYNTNEKYYNDAEEISGDSFTEAYNKAKRINAFHNVTGYNDGYETKNMFNWNGRTYKIPEETIKDKYERLSGIDWNTAKKYGFTDGSYNQNILLGEALDFMTILGLDKSNIDINDFAKYYADFLNSKFLKGVENGKGAKVPVNKNNIITLTNAGINTGTKIPIDLMDYIMETAERTNTPLNIAFGLPAQESAFGFEDNNGARATLFKDMNGNYYTDINQLVSNWSYSNDNKVNGYLNSKNANADNFKYSININDFLNSIEERKNIPVLEHAYNLFKTGKYNSGDTRHTNMVIQRGNSFINSPEFKEYLKDYESRKLNSKQYGGVLDATYMEQINRIRQPRFAGWRFKDGGIHIKESHEGLFTKQANAAGMNVQEFARHVLANKDNYSSTTIKRANFARNATKFNH